MSSTSSEIETAEIAARRRAAGAAAGPGSWSDRPRSARKGGCRALRPGSRRRCGSRPRLPGPDSARWPTAQGPHDEAGVSNHIAQNRCRRAPGRQPRGGRARARRAGQVRRGLGGVRRLVKEPPLARERLVGPEHDAVRIAPADGQRLRARETAGHLRRPGSAPPGRPPRPRARRRRALPSRPATRLLRAGRGGSNSSRRAAAACRRARAREARASYSAMKLRRWSR